jgi:hypothetical protein
MISILYLISFILLEYSIHCQRIIKSFLMSDLNRNSNRCIY